MKKILSIMIILAGMFMLTGCSEDALIANDLKGIWRGEIAQEYFNHRGGRVTEYTEVEYEFYGEGVRGGTGRELAYYGSRRYDVSNFDYEVRDGNIYLYFHRRGYGNDIIIRDYHLSERTFGGIFQDYYTKDDIARFTMIRVGDYYYNGAVVYKPAQNSNADKTE